MKGRPGGAPANLVPFGKGAAWNGNAGGRPKGFTRLLKELMTQRELCGVEVPGGRTVEQALVEAAVMQAIKGNASILAQIWDRLEGPVKDRLAEDVARNITFEIVHNNRDPVIEIEAKTSEGSGPSGGDAPADDGKL